MLWCKRPYKNSMSKPGAIFTSEQNGFCAKLTLSLYLSIIITLITNRVVLHGERKSQRMRSGQANHVLEATWLVGAFSRVSTRIVVSLVTNVLTPHPPSALCGPLGSSTISHTLTKILIVVLYPYG